MPLNRMEKDARNRAAMTYLTGRAPPPRFRPMVIILMVLVVGAIIIGLITTILAYFPGYSAKGVSALRIAGPVVLAGSFLVLLGMILEICLRHQKESKLVEKSFHDLTSSRMTLASRQSAMSVSSSNPPAATAQPSKSILKNASSSSTYSDSGVPGHSGSYEQDSSSTGSAVGIQYKVDMNPDPTAQRNHAPRNQVPRTAKPQNGYQPPAQPPTQPQQPGRSYGNRAYSHESDPRETDIDGDLEVNGHSTPNASRKQAAPPREQPKRVMQSYANQGFDVYDPATSLTGAGLLQTSGLMETPSSSPARPADQTPRRWGSSSNPTTPRMTQPPAGYGNQAYAADTPTKNSRQQVSTVTETYQQVSSSHTPRQVTTRKYQHSAQRQAPSPRPAQTPSSSTEV